MDGKGKIGLSVAILVGFCLPALPGQDLAHTPSVGFSPRPDFSLTNPAAFGHTFEQLDAQARSAIDRGDFDTAITYYNQALSLELSPAQASVTVMRRGIAHLGQNDSEHALADFDEAIRLDARNPAAYENRGLVLDRTGDREGAMADFNEALRLNPRSVQGYLNRGSEFFDGGQLDAALNDFGKAAQIEPNNPQTCVFLAAIYLRKGQYREAIAECDHAIKSDPNSFGAYLDRAKAHVHLGQKAAAKADLKKAAALRTTTPGAAPNTAAWVEATAVEPALRDGHTAVTLATNACRITHWKEWRYLDTLAAAYAEMGDFDQATKWETEALHLAHGDAERIEKAKQRLALYQQRKPYREDYK
jgi:tetratricopeptide (TPR) repeat protein